MNVHQVPNQPPAPNQPPIVPTPPPKSKMALAVKVGDSIKTLSVLLFWGCLGFAALAAALIAIKGIWWVFCKVSCVLEGN